MATIQVNLEFNANTKNAKQQIQELQNTLNQAISSSMSGKNLGISPQLDQARQSALQLKIALEGATNVDTGKLNLNKFTNSLRSSGISITQLATQLKSLGPQGVQAFNQMTSAMASAETRLFTLSSGMQKLANTFFNTMRYQASAMAIQSVTKSITSAINYTKDLNKALTDIAIVTQDSGFNMANFAAQANKAAKSLATTTTEYAKAAHIYFQQGLDTAEAMKRAETTIRLAHATGESMEEVSNWMTAIWNNFDNGTKSLEYYGDVLAKLGAATASSADEIAQGLGKFAAVAETVGLSYEYAASALATITAETRQSADVVGTALKTLFSRMESLSLGETLDDGTTLNKYSLALQTVGVNIKAANGDLKDMDQILDETAARWETLSKDQQVALAQNVAGVRQYTQFIALMDNYDVMKSNIDMSKQASGSLQEMQDTYEKSIEGLQEKSKAAGEELISSLVDEDSIKNFYKATAGIAEFATKLTKSFGGLEGILLTVSAAMLKMYQPKVATFIQNTAYGLQDLKTQAQNAGRSFTNLFRSNDNKKPMLMTTGEKMREEALQQDSLMQQQQMGGMAGTKVTQQINDLKMNLYRNEKKLTDEAKQQIQWQIQLLELTRDNLAAEEKRLEVVRQTNMEKGDAINENVATPEQQREKTKNINKMTMASQNAVKMLPSVDAVTTPGYESTADAEKLISYLKEARKAAQELGLDITDLGFDDALAGAQLFKEGSLNDFEQLQNKIISINSELQKVGAMSRVNTDTSSIAIDTNYIQTRGEAIGQMEYGAEATVNAAKNQQQVMANVGKETMRPEQKQELGANMLKSLEESKVKAEQLGLNIKDLGFEDAELDIKKFADTGELELNELIKKLEEFQSKVQQASTAELKNTVENAGIGALDKTVAGYNQVQNASFQSGTENQAAAVVSGVEKMGKQASPKLKQKSNDLKYLQDRRKQLKQLQTQELKNAKTEEDKIKIENKYSKLLKGNKKLIQNKIKDIQKDTKATGKNIDEQKNAVKASEEYNDLMDERGEKMSEAAQSSKDLGKEEAALQGKVNSTGDSVKALNDKIAAGGEKIQSFGTKMASGLSTMMSVVSGINMLKNGFQQLSTALAEGEYGFDTWASAAMSILPALMQILPSIISVTSAVYAKVGALMAAKAASKAEADQAVADSGKKVASNIVEGTSNVAKNVAKGYAFWPAAIAGAAALAMVGATIALPLLAGGKESKEEQKEKKLENKREVNAAAGEVSKSLTGLSEQVDTFKNLRESGESTVEVLKDMENTIDEVGFQIDKILEKKPDGDTWNFLEGAKSQLETGLDDLKAGRITVEEYEAQVQQITNQVNRAAVQSARQVYEEGGWKAEDRGAYTQAIGTALQGNDEWMAEAENNFLSGQPYSTVEEAQAAWATAAINAALGPEYNDEATNENTIAQLMNYAPTQVHRIINGIRMFEPNGAMQNKYGEQGAAAAKAWIGNDSNKLAYANNIDFSQPQDTWDDQYQAAMDKGEEAKITMEAQELGYDEATFETYTDLLVDTNEHLKENDKTSKQIALNNLKLNKGLATLADSWQEIDEVLDNGKRGTIEYAEALGKIKNALQEAFGYAPSTEFIEQNLENIEKLAEGDVSVLQDLQDKLAEDYVAHMEIATAIDGNGMSPEAIRATLTNLLNSIDTSVELGEGTTISDEYLDSLQAMLDSGQITAAQLQGLMRAKGFEMEITGWKKVPGPKKEITQEITGTDANGKEINYKKVIKEQEEMEVPIINGEAPDVSAGQSLSRGSVGKAGLVKSSDASVINQSTLDKNKGGGGGGSEKKNLDDELERYHEIDKTLERLNRQYDKISKAKDRAFGKSRLNLIQQEIKATEELAKATETKLVEAEGHLADDRDKLSEFGASFNEYGEITNYEELVKAQVDAYNADPEGQEENYQRFQDYLSQYEETLSTVEDLRTQMDDYAYDIFDKKLEGIQYQVELDVRLADNDLALIEFQLEQLDDTAADVAKKFDLLGQSMEANEKKMEAASKGIGEILGLSGIELEEAIANPDQLAALVEGKELTEDQISALEDYVNQMYDGVNAMKEMYEAVSDDLVAAFEDMNEEMDNSISRLEHLNSMVDSYRNIIDLAGREALGVNAELMEQMSKSQYKIANSNIEVTKAKYQQNAAALAELEKQIEDARASGNEETLKELEEAYDELYQTVWDDEQALLDATSAGLEAATALFEEEMNNIVGVFEDAMTGAYGTFAAMQEAFDQQKEINDRYLDDYTKIYNLSKLNRDLVNSIDNSDSIWAKTRLRDLQQEINDLQESNTKMTQYEVDELRAKYDLRLAEIALEEAQNAKNQVRMVRTSEGNWSYMYTADEDATSKAEQGYEDKLHAYQQLVQNYTDEMQARLIQIPAEYAEAVKTIYQDQTLNDQERQLKIMETQTYYEGMYAHVIEQLGISNEDAAALYKEDWSRYAQMTGYKISEDQLWVDTFAETIASQVTGLETLDAAQNNFKVASDTMLTGLAQSYTDYRANVQETLDLATGDIDKFLGLDGSEGGLKYYLDEATKEAGEAADEAKRVGKENEDAFKKAVQAAKDWLDDYGTEITKWTTETTKIATAVNGVTTAYSNLDKQIDSTIGKYKALEDQAKAAAAAQNSVGDGSGSGSYTPGTTTTGTVSFKAYSAGKKLKGMQGYTGVGSKENFSNIDKSTIKTSTEFEKQLEDGYGHITFTNENGKTQNAYIDFSTAKSLGLIKGSSAPTTFKGLKNTSGNTTVYYRTTTGTGVLTMSTYHPDVKGGKLIRPSLIDSPQPILDTWNGYVKLNYTWNGKKMTGWFKESDVSLYDTGGYTGEWDSSGRLAMLHQKEIVLNAHDTENFLSGINVLRDITNAIDLQALSRTNMLSAIKSVTAIPTTQNLEQSVSIQAEFPNATEKSEIEAAFESLLNRASQFANRKNK